MREPNIEVQDIKCMEVQYIEVKGFGKTRMILLHPEAVDLFWKLAQVLSKLCYVEAKNAPHE